LFRLLNQLCATLDAHALAANELRVRLKLEDRSEIERLLRLPIAMRDPRTFLKLLMLDIESHPPQSAVAAVSIAAEPAPPRSLQKGLFQPVAPEPEKLELTIARLVKLVGADNIGSPELMDTHRPGAFRMKRFGVKRRDEASKGKFKGRKRTKRSAKSTWERGRPARLPPNPNVAGGTPALPGYAIPNPQSAIRTPQYHMGFRVFRPPLRAKVESVSGRPARISARAAGGSISGKVVRLAGPWRTSGEWWMEERWDRAEWDVALGATASEKQVLYKIYYDLRDDAWFIEGTYD
jgi:protein ImuB